MQTNRLNENYPEKGLHGWDFPLERDVSAHEPREDCIEMQGRRVAHFHPVSFATPVIRIIFDTSLRLHEIQRPPKAGHFIRATSSRYRK